jgi:hypothetical protein
LIARLLGLGWWLFFCSFVVPINTNWLSNTFLLLLLDGLTFLSAQSFGVWDGISIVLLCVSNCFDGLG